MIRFKGREPGIPRGQSEVQHIERTTLAVRILVAFAGGSQKELGRLARFNPARISLYCTGKARPKLGTLERLANAVKLPLPFVEGLVADGLAFRAVRSHQIGASAKWTLRRREPETMQALGQRLAKGLDVRLSALALSARPMDNSASAPKADLALGEALWRLLERLQPLEREAVVAAAPEFQTWALVVLLADESWERAQAEPQESLGLARLAVQVARRIGGSAGWRSRVQGFAEAHVAHALRLNGDLANAEASFAHAKRCFAMGRASDPGGLLSPSRVLLLEAELRRLKGRARISNATSISGCGAVNSR